MLDDCNTAQVAMYYEVNHECFTIYLVSSCVHYKALTSMYSKVRYVWETLQKHLAMLLINMNIKQEPQLVSKSSPTINNQVK